MNSFIVIFTARSLFLIHELYSIDWQLCDYGKGGF